MAKVTDVLDLGFDTKESNRKRRKRLRKWAHENQSEIHAGSDKAEDLNLPRQAYGRGGDRLSENFRERSYLDIRAHRASTRVFAAAFPFLSQGSLGHEGAYMGQDVSGGGAFCADPWEWYNKGHIDGTSMILIGTVGTGKSTCAKSLVTRLVQSGRKAAICSDLKGEWVKVARFLGGGVISVGPGKKTRINPLDEGTRPTRDSEGHPMKDEMWAAIVRTRRLALLTTLVGILLNARELEPEEHTALVRSVDAAVAGDGPVTLPEVVHHLRNPTPAVAAEVGENGQRLYHALSRCLDGDLAGMFDGESTERFDSELPIMVIDTRALKGASVQARKITNACTAAWVEAAVTSPDAGQRILVYEEGWDSMSDPYSLARMVEQWKLAREYGIANLLIMHKVADSDMAGDAGSQTQAMAKSLLTDAEIRIVYRQKPDALAATQEAFGLTDAETKKVRSLPKGHGLWKIADKFSYIVNNIMTEAEIPVFNTDERMKTETGSGN